MSSVRLVTCRSEWKNRQAQKRSGFYLFVNIDIFDVHSHYTIRTTTVFPLKSKCTQMTPFHFALPHPLFPSFQAEILCIYWSLMRRVLQRSIKREKKRILFVIKYTSGVRHMARKLSGSYFVIPTFHLSHNTRCQENAEKRWMKTKQNSNPVDSRMQTKEIWQTKCQ